MWSVSRALQVPLDPKLRDLTEIPYTISFIIRKRQQIDNLNELPKEKRPPEDMIWSGTPEEMDEWLEHVFDNRGKFKDKVEFKLNANDVEG